MAVGKFPKGILELTGKLAEVAEFAVRMVGDPARRRELSLRLQVLRAEGIALARENCRHLALTFVAVPDRGELQQLNRLAEDLLKELHHLALRAALLRLEPVRPAAAELLDAVRELTVIVGRMAAAVTVRRELDAGASQLRRVRDEASLLYTVAHAELSEEMPATPAAVLETMRWWSFLDQIDAAAEQAARVGDAIESYAVSRG